MLRLVAAIVAGCALIGQAHADPIYTVDEAIRNIATAYLANNNCPGVKIDHRKVAQMIIDSHLDIDQVYHQNGGPARRPGQCH